MVNTKRIKIVIDSKVYTLSKHGNKYFFCGIEVAKESLEEILVLDPENDEYNRAVSRGQTHETALFVINLSNTMYLTDAPCMSEQQTGFLWTFFSDIGALLYNNSHLIKNHMDFLLQDGLFKYKNNSIPMETEEQENTNYIHELLS